MSNNKDNITHIIGRENILSIISFLVSKLHLHASSLSILELSIEEFLNTCKDLEASFSFSFEFKDSLLRLYFTIEGDFEIEKINTVVRKLKSNPIFTNLVEYFNYQSDIFEIIYSFSFLSQNISYNRTKLIKEYLAQQEFMIL